MSRKYRFYEVNPETWEEAKRIGKSLRFCVYRGQASQKWNLSTSLERAAKQFSFPREGLWDQEQRILYEFRARAHQFIQSPPHENEYIEWLSLVQHHGGPTRLLDFTRSFYIASFFAIESAIEDSSVWAISDIFMRIDSQDKNPIKLDSEKAYPSNLEAQLRYAESFIVDSRACADLTVPVIPPRLNERLAVQRGLFLFPCNLNKSFESNLCTTFNFPFDQLNTENAIQVEPNAVNEDIIVPTRVMKINLSRKFHREAMYDLFSMNIDSASLFPGLDGFARSLRLMMRQMDRPTD
jgi:hypothetical protein